MSDLFNGDIPTADAEARRRVNRAVPLAARMRPRTLAEYAGQKHILGEGKLLKRAIEADRFSSLNHLASG